VARLGIDATSVSPQGKGIARVQRHSVEALQRSGRHELVVFARDPEALAADCYEVSGRAIVWEQVGMPRAYRRHGLDALLTWTERLPLVGRGRYLVWLFEPPTHRIATNRAVGASAYQSASDLVTQALWKRSLRRAAVVLTGSNATRDALDVPARRLYPGLDPRFSPGPAESKLLSATNSDRYVFSIASSDPREDTDAALRAFAQVDVPVKVAGGWVGPPLEKVEYLGRVSDQELVELYRGAAAYVDTSRYEGFGFQVLEAMACGAPVIATGGTSIPEIVGEAGIVCAPDELAAELRRVLDDQRLAADMRRRGVERASQFTWDRVATTIADAVDEVAS
jgi:glycosyltransferase involved in cell wall biosynthesis